jgi:hypothetical protein
VQICQLLQHKLYQRCVVFAYQCAQPGSILRPAIAGDKCGCRPGLDASKGRVNDGAQRPVGVRLSSNYIQRISIQIRPSRPPRSSELHSDLDGRPIAQRSQSTRLHGGKTSFTEVDGAENG